MGLMRTITSPFRKARTILNSPTKDHKKPQNGNEQCEYGMNLQGEVMACGYEDVQVMWSILDKTRSREQITRS